MLKTLILATAGVALFATPAQAWHRHHHWRHHHYYRYYNPYWNAGYVYGGYPVYGYAYPYPVYTVRYRYVPTYTYVGYAPLYGYPHYWHRRYW